MTASGRFLPVIATNQAEHIGRTWPAGQMRKAGQVQCKRLVNSNAIDWSLAMQTSGQVECNYAI